MTKASFYILKPQTQTIDLHSTRLKIVARVCKKAIENQITILADKTLHTDISAMLWEVGDCDFLAHSINNAQCHINITDDRNVLNTAVIVNLTNDAITSTNTSRILEFILPDEQNKILGRERYIAYKKAGFTLENHDIVV